MEEKINELSAYIAAQRKETDCVEDVCCHLANQNWSLGWSIERSKKHIEELERELLSAKETIDKLHVDLCKLDVHIVKSQEKIRDVKSKTGLLEMHVGVHSASLDNFSQCLNEAEEALNRCGQGWDHYDRDHQWNVLMGHHISQWTCTHCQHLQRLDQQLEQLKILSVERSTPTTALILMGYLPTP